MNAQQVAILVESALDARRRAYAPYSKFFVGAALQTDGGEIFSGCNVENASYGLTMCAERVAVMQAIAAGRRQFTAIAVATSGASSPCGACRQVLAEFADDLPVFLVNAEKPDSQLIEINLRDLLPFGFQLRTRSERE